MTLDENKTTNNKDSIPDKAIALLRKVFYHFI